MALLKAAQEGSISRCRQPLEARSYVGERNTRGFTSLLLAAREGHPGVCELLLERGKANFEETTPVEITALNLAATKGHASMVFVLLSKGGRWTQGATMVSHLCSQQLKKATLRCASCSWKLVVMWKRGILSHCPHLLTLLQEAAMRRSSSC